MAGHAARRPAREASDYFVRQGTDPDGLAAELATPEQRRRYIATFYTQPVLGPPGRSSTRRAAGASAVAVVDFHTEPFGDAATLRASRSAATRARSIRPRASEPTLWPATSARPTLRALRPHRPRALPRLRPHGGRRVPAPRRAVPAPRLRPLRAVGGAARAGQRDIGDGVGPPRGAPIGRAVKGLISRRRRVHARPPSSHRSPSGRAVGLEEVRPVITGVSTEGDTPPG